MIQRMTLTINGKPLDIAMDLDPAVPTDAALLFYLQHQRIPEPEVVTLMARVLKPGDFAVDGGANIGFFTILMAQLVGESGEVLAVEPGSNNIHRLKTNLALSKIENVFVSEEALVADVMADDGAVQFSISADGGRNACWSVEGAIVEQRVGATTLDRLCDCPPKLIKLDIEGSEVAALRGATDLLHYPVPYIVTEMNPNALAKMNETPESLRAFMKAAGYQLFLLHEGSNLPALVPEETALAISRENTNVLFSTLKAVGEAWSEANI